MPVIPPNEILRQGAVVRQVIDRAAMPFDGLVNHVWIDEAAAAMMQKPAAQVQPKYKIFWGGPDLDPSFYGAERSNMCGHSNLDKDAETIATMQDYIDKGIPIIGICRGAQILNVVNNGILVQHIEGHTHTHDVTLYDKEGNVTGAGQVSSTHHQMMIPHKDGIILAKDHRPVNGVHWDDVDTMYTYERVVEVVYYPKTKSLCIQPHPEWMKQDMPFVKWINKFIQNELGLQPLNFSEEEFKFITTGQ